MFGKPFIILSVVVLSFVFGFYGLARDTGATDDLPGTDLTIEDVLAIITNLACWLTRVVGAVMVIFVIVSGFFFMGAGGSPERYTRAKKNFTQVLIGGLVIFGVYVIIATVANAVGVTDFSFIPLVC